MPTSVMCICAGQRIESSSAYCADCITKKGEYSQAKLVRVIKGKVLDVAVDLRQSSPTFGKYVSVELSEENKRQFFIPRGFAHGFLVLSEEAIFTYKVDNGSCPSGRSIHPLQ